MSVLIRDDERNDRHMRITIDADKCCGAGNCVRRAPDVFDQDDDGIVVLLEANPTGSMAQDAKAAAELCPTWAISTADEPASTSVPAG